MFKALSNLDPTSFSRPDLCVTRKLNISLDIDFNTRILSGEVDIEIEKVDINTTELILDTCHLTITSVKDLVGQSLSYKLSENIPPFGSKLVINLPTTTATHLTLRIIYETSTYANGLQWLEPNQTNDKLQPFMFSQFESINARSVIPCQDTPNVKTPYLAQITAPSSVTVLMSAVTFEGPISVDGNRRKHRFEQKIPVPSYLIAIVAGKLEKRKIGARTYIWAEPNMIEAAAYEFAETENFLAAAEKICGPYEWKIFGILVLPPSFPYGGMENPCLTYVTSTLIAGDRSLTAAIAHEISHSWLGNLVTNCTFEHFWLNEGFAVFLERKILCMLYGPLVSDFEAMIGLADLNETINDMGEDHPLTKLVTDLRGIDPDKIVNAVPYEKGYFFLRYLEHVVGGPAKFEPFLFYFVNLYKYKSICSDELRDVFMQYFAKHKNLKTINWKAWLHNSGMPPEIVPRLDNTLANACIDLKNKWTSWNEQEAAPHFSIKDLKLLSGIQIIYFLQLLLDAEKQPISKLKLMEDVYKFSESKNIEIKYRWIRIGLKSQWMNRVPDAIKLVSEIGRIKYVKPIYLDLYNWEEVRPKAIEVYKKNKSSMMFVTSTIIKQILHI